MSVLKLFLITFGIVFGLWAYYKFLPYNIKVWFIGVAASLLIFYGAVMFLYKQGAFNEY